MYYEMDEVDRKASTKECEEEGIVNRDHVTIEPTDGKKYFTGFTSHLQCVSKLSSQLYSCSSLYSRRIRGRGWGKG